jgi:hypothetical protein
VVSDNIAFSIASFVKKRANDYRKNLINTYDMFLEMIKTSISKEEMEKRFVCKNLETYLAFEEKGKSVALMLPTTLVMNGQSL